MSGLSRNLIAQFGINQDKQSRLYVPSDGGSFFTAPIRIVDTEHIESGAGVATDIDFRFQQFNPWPVQTKNKDNTITNSANQPQWYDGVTTPFTFADYNVRCSAVLDTNDLPPTTFYMNHPSTIGTWKGFGSAQNIMINKPSVGNTNFARCVIQFAAIADLSTILAQAEY